MTLALRYYQREAIEAIYRYFATNTGNPLIVVPAGGGKTPIMAEFTRSAIGSFPDTRILLLSHVKELLDQSYRTLLDTWPEAPASLYSAGLRSRDMSGQIVVAGIQSIYKKAYDLQRVDLILLDECQMLSDGDGTMYRRLFSDLAAINGGPPPVIGLSATPWREGSGLLHRGPNALFTDIAFEIGLGELIEQGWLAPLRCKSTETKLDATGVHVRQGEYVASELQAAVDKDEINRAIVAELIEKGRDRKAWLIFASGVEHGRHLCNLINAGGIEAACVFGETPGRERDATIADFRAGRLRCLVNVAALLVGFDVPHVDLIGIATCTRSKNRYVQLLGRGTRLAPGKTDCRVLDWGGVVAQHGPVDLVRGVEKRKGSSDEPATAPVKVCPECDEQVHAGFRQCPACGYEWPILDAAEKLHGRAIVSAVLSNELQASDWLPVSRVTYHEHRKPGSPPSLRVNYYCGLRHYSEWLCIEHPQGSYPRRKAVEWWQQRSTVAMPGGAFPASVKESVAIAGDVLRTPIAIRVRPDGRFFKIVAVRFAAPVAEAA